MTKKPAKPKTPETETEAPKPELTKLQIQMLSLRLATKMLYDLQGLRIQSGNRERADLDKLDQAFMVSMSEGLEKLEAAGLKEIKSTLKGIPIYEHWLKDQKGVGPTMAAVLLSYIPIERIPNVGKLWAFCGLAVRNGVADRRVKGQKATFNPWLKAKLTFVLGTSFLRANSPWRKFYDDYKHRKENTILPICMGCNGTGQYKPSAKDIEQAAFAKEEAPKPSKCSNCDGRGIDAPWGRSKKHRDIAATRYMVKMFLQALWIEWRTIEGLDVRKPYAEEYLGHTYSGDNLLIPRVP